MDQPLQMTKCPSCQRRPSERLALRYNVDDQYEHTCDHPIHDRADEAPEVGLRLTTAEADLAEAFELLNQAVVAFEVRVPNDLRRDIAARIRVFINQRLVKRLKQPHVETPNPER